MIKAIFEILRVFFFNKNKYVAAPESKVKVLSIGEPYRAPKIKGKKAYVPKGELVELSKDDKKKLVKFIHSKQCCKTLRKDPIDKKCVWKQIKHFKRTYEIKLRDNEIIEAYLTKDVDKLDPIQDFENALLEEDKEEIRKIIINRLSYYLGKSKLDENVKLHLVKYKGLFLQVEYKNSKVVKGKYVEYKFNLPDITFTKHFIKRLETRIGIEWVDDFYHILLKQLVPENILAFKDETILFKVNIFKVDFNVVVEPKEGILLTALLPDWR